MKLIQYSCVYYAVCCIVRADQLIDTILIDNATKKEQSRYKQYRKYEYFLHILTVKHELYILHICYKYKYVGCVQRRAHTRSHRILISYFTFYFIAHLVTAIRLRYGKRISRRTQPATLFSSCSAVLM